MIAFEHPLWLLALPLAALPWWRAAADADDAPALRWLPADRPSQLLAHALRAATALALAALVLALAAPYRPEAEVARVGTGAEIAIVLDRSRSMDQSFAGSRPAPAPAAGGSLRPETIDAYMRMQGQRSSGRSKAVVARELLADFARARPDDRFAFVAFSTAPLRVLDFTGKPEVIQAAISAGAGTRGLSETDIGRALDTALDLYEDRPYTGSRLILLVSDGGDHIEPSMVERLRERARRLRVGFAWIYLRAINAPGLEATDSAAGSVESLPEIFLHRMFQRLGLRYHAYEADNTEALKDAIADVGRLENLPLAYTDHTPRAALAPWALWLALAGIGLLLAARALQRRAWPQARGVTAGGPRVRVPGLRSDARPVTPEPLA